MLYLFTGADELPGDFISTCSCFLPKWRLDLMMSYRFASDRKLCALAYVVLVYALKNEGLFTTLPKFGYRADGKPFLTNYPGIHFNVSHSRDVVVCLLSDREVGVDVEKTGEYDDELARAVCNDREYRWVNGIPDPQIKAKNFTLLWTRKESLVKCFGTGLTTDLKELLNGQSPDHPRGDLQISSLYHPEGNFYISVCRNSQ